ncbi:AraC family transcriptional regulator (plasmid) [Streptomyces sp. NBC_00841]|uniref:AraC family transcriptional regulator n=1 Tax=Streptomyces sp. NBC_00841 TaxID=2975847 RepID=UPI002DDB201F|nr:AraC family transcriptional regulator [Streptomyces sp. NBC_00841]WSA05504.1 AraC family transcriptional regulator [Streptomyces sp. NBC_00841]
MLLDELRALLVRHARGDATTAIEHVLIGREESQAPHASMTGTVMALIAQGAKRLALGDRVFEYGPGQYLVASVDLPVTGHFVGATPEQPALGLGLLLQSSDVAEMMLQAAHGCFRPNGTAPSAIAVSDASEELLDAAVRLLRLLDQPRDRDMLAPLVKREILWRLITGEQGSTVRQIGLADSKLSHIARAVHWIRENYRHPFRVDDVAELIGMSTSAFYRNFQAVTGMSPIQFQKKIRLHEARLLLATHPKDIAHIGYRVGYDSPSQFSREYRRLFGAPPSQDAVRFAARTAGERD